MAHHDDHDAHALPEGELHTPPCVPEVHDEAGPSPNWLPVIGGSILLALTVAVVTYRGLRDSAEPGHELVVPNSEEAAAAGPPEAPSAAPTGAPSPAHPEAEH